MVENGKSGKRYGDRIGGDLCGHAGHRSVGQQAVVSLKMIKRLRLHQFYGVGAAFCVGRSMWAMEIVEFQITVGVALELLLI